MVSTHAIVVVARTAYRCRPPANDGWPRAIASCLLGVDCSSGVGVPATPPTVVGTASAAFQRRVMQQRQPMQPTYTVGPSPHHMAISGQGGAGAPGLRRRRGGPS